MGLRFDNQADLERFLEGKAAKANKYNAKPEVRDGVRHDSKGEADWADGLRERERGGEIHGLVLDKERLKFPIFVNEYLIATYTADAVWRDRGGKRHVADFKSGPTAKRRDYQLIRKLMKAVYGIEIEEHGK